MSKYKLINTDRTVADIMTEVASMKTARIANKQAEVRAKADKEIEKVRRRAEIKVRVLEITENENRIWYDHTNNININRMSHGDKFPEDKVEELRKLCVDMLIVFAGNSKT